MRDRNTDPVAGLRFSVGDDLRLRDRPCIGAFRIALLWTVLGTLSHTSAAKHEPFADGQRWAHFTTQDGLPSKVVFGVAEARGVLWAATHQDLAYFDGWRWRRADVGNQIGKEIYELHADRTGALWVSSSKGLFLGRGSGFEPVKATGLDERPGWIDAVADLPDGTVLLHAPTGEEVDLLAWRGGEVSRVATPIDIATKFHVGMELADSGRVFLHLSDGLYAYDGVRFELVLPMSDREVVCAVAENADGVGVASIWTGDSTGGLWEWRDGGDARRVAGEGVAWAYQAAVDESGDVIVFYPSGRIRARLAETWGELDPLAQGLRIVTDVTFRENGDLVVAGDHGVFRYRARDWRWRRWSFDEVNDWRNDVTDIEIDATGVVWAATKGGILTIDGDTLVEHAAGDVERAIGESLALLDGEAYAPAAEGGLLRRVAGAWRLVARDATGRVLPEFQRVVTDHLGRTWALRSSPDSEGEPSVYRVDGDRITPWQPAVDEGVQRVRDLASGEDGAIWLATRYGVSRLADGEWFHWTSDDGLARRRCSRIACDDRGRAWVLHPWRGVSVIDRDETARGIDIDHQRMPTRLTDFDLGPSGELWVASRYGLYLVVEDLVSYFGFDEGLEHLALNAVRAAPGRLLLGTDGAGVLELDTREANDPPPCVEVESLSVGNSQVVSSWSARSYEGQQARDLVRTRYRLNDGPWSPWSRDREVSLQRPLPGDHQFEVQAIGMFGQLSDVDRRSFRVDAPYYQRPAFLVPVGVLTVSVVWFALLLLRDRRRSERAIRKREQEYRRLIEESSDAILIFGPDGRCTEVNQRATEALGIGEEQLHGMSLHDLFPRAGRDLERLAVDRAAMLLCDHQREDGERIQFEAMVDLLGDGRTKASLRDLTERQRVDQERRVIEEHATELQKLEGLRELAGGVAHDFNNLLMIILGNLDLMQLAGSADELAEGIEHARFAVLQSRDLTRQLLAYAGDDRFDREPCDLNRVVREMGDLLRSSVSKGVTIRVHQSTDPIVIEADVGRIRQVILNLVLNSSDAIGVHGKGTVEITTRRVVHEIRGRGGARESRDCAELTVRDDGVGMTEEAQERIFEPFFSTKQEGRGLGLAAVSAIMKSHGGEVRVRSAPGAGAEFQIVLPASDLSIGEDGDESSRWSGELGLDGDVLVIDDEESLLRVVGRYVKALGLGVLTANSGDKGIALLEEHRATVVAVVLDVTMPGTSGVEVLDRVRAAHPHMPVILMSGYARMTSGSLEASELASGFLRKPFNLEQLRRLLYDLLAVEEPG